MKSVIFALWAAGLAALGGCGGDEKAKGDLGGGGSGPLYVISTGVPSGDDFLGFLVTVPSLEASASFTLEHATEIEPSWIFAKPGASYIYAASLFTPTITRYDLQADGTFAANGVVDFSNFGVSGAYLAALAPIYSDTKSFFVDDGQDQVVIWNPSEMRAIGTIPLGDAIEGTLPPAPEGTMVLHDGKLLTAVDWADWSSDSTTYGSHSRLHVIDPVTSTLVQSTDEERITYASPQTTASDGTIYFSPASLIAAYRTIAAGRGSASHVIRVKPGAQTFDAAYDLDLGTLVGGRPAGDFTLLDDETAVMRVWHAELVDPVTPDGWEDVLWGQAGFLWWRWHVGDAEAVQIADQSPGTLGSTLLKIDGKSYVVRTNDDSASTTLDEIDADGGFRAGVNGPGQFIGNGVIRLR